MQSRTRNNTIAGAFVLATVFGFLALVITLSDIGGLGRERSVEAAFPLHVGAPGLEVGAEVTVGYVTIGRVTEIEQHLDPSGPYGQHVGVLFTIPDDLTLREGARAELVVPLIGAGATLNVLPGDGEPIPNGLKLPGRLAPPFFLTSSGIGDDQVESLQRTIASIDELTSFLRSAVETEGPAAVEQLMASIDRFSEAVESIRDITASAGERWPIWSASVDRTLANVSDASERAPELADSAQRVMSNIEGGVNEARQTLASVRPDILDAAENIRATTEELRFVTLAKVHDLLDRTRATVNEALAAVDFIHENLRAEVPQIAQALGNMRIASNNLKLAMIEIRAQPWKVLYKPGEAEIEESLLYDSVRTYANAVSDLNAAAASLKALHDRYGAQLEPEDETLQRVLNQLQDSFESYQEAEETWFDLLLEKTN